MHEHDTPFLASRAFPALERMAPEDRRRLVDPLQSIRRAARLHIDAENLEYAERHFQDLEERIRRDVGRIGAEYDEIIYDGGGRTSELNAFLSEQSKKSVVVRLRKMLVDEPIMLKSSLMLKGVFTELEAAPELSQDPRCANGVKCFIAKGCKDFAISGFRCGSDLFDYNAFICDCINFRIEGNVFANARIKSIALLKEATSFIISGNMILKAGMGGVFANGLVDSGIIENNRFHNGQDWHNFCAAVLLGSVPVTNPDTAYNDFQDIMLYDLLDSPHEIIVKDNFFVDNDAQGVYSHASYSVCITGNVFAENQKEGMCLDYGTLGCLVERNAFVGNGSRARIATEKNKYNMLPGLSIDNSSYNLVAFNTFSGNFGSGVKAVRASCRNVICQNDVFCNNAGASDFGHFFGIELASDRKPDYDGVSGLDFCPCYENIIAGNVITGPHYSGIYLGHDSYCNDCFDNSIEGFTNFRIENMSEYFNSALNNG